MERYMWDKRTGEVRKCKSIHEYVQYEEACGQEGGRLRKTVIGTQLVSTVLSGINLAIGVDPPVLWETMVFGKGPLEEAQERYTSMKAALAGHEKMVCLLRKARKEIVV